MKDVPELAAQLAEGAGDMSGSPVLGRAPLVLQESLLFPYTEGLTFEEAVLVKSGTERAFAGTLDQPPSSSFEILHPAQYLAHAAVPVLRLPDIHPLLDAAGYEPYDVGVMGEVDVRMTTELFGGRPMAEALAPNWAGGIYYAAQKKTAVNKDSTASLSLLYSSRWKNESSARSFFQVYDGQLPRKYSGLKRRKADEKDDTERVYSTDEGDVLLTFVGNNVYIGEGFDLALSRKLRDAVDAANPQGSGRIMQAESGAQGSGPGVQGELLGGLSQWINSFGMMKVGLIR